MEPGLVTATNLTHFHGLTRIVPICHVNLNRSLSASSSPSRIYVTSRKASRSWVTFCSSNPSKSSDRNSVSTANRIEETLDATLAVDNDESQQNRLRVEVGSPTVLPYLSTAKLSLSDQAFFLLTFIACTTSVAFTSLVIAAIPTLFAIGRAAISLSKLADTAREELPSTMAAVRLSGMEISDLTLELSDLSHEIADGVSKSSLAFQAADTGIRQIGSLARQQTMSMIQERAELPIISLQPVVAGAAKKTSRAVGQATKTFMNLISRGELSSQNENKEAVDRLEI